MRYTRVAAAALNQTPLDWEENAAHICSAIQSAKEARAQLLCLPELCISGYGCEDAFYSRAVVEMAEQVLGEILPRTQDMVVSVGLPVLHSGALFNASAVCVNGQLAGLVAKQHLAGDGLHYEPRWFKPWPDNAVGSIHILGKDLPIGDLVFDFHGVRLGFEICEDAWVANRPGVEYSQWGVDVLFNPSASHFAFGKSETRRRLVEESSRALGVTYVYGNLVGNEAGRIIYDGQTLIASCGEVVACGPRLSLRPVTMAVASVDIDATRMRRAQSASFQPLVVPDSKRLVLVDHKIPSARADRACAELQGWESSPTLKEEEFARAVMLGLFDYVRKSRSRGFIISLSGGADSAAIACLAALLVREALRVFDGPSLCKLLGLPPLDNEPVGAEVLSTDASSELYARQITERLLTTVYQSTRNSSDVTRNAARGVAEAIGAQHLELDVDDICELYTQKVEAAIHRRLDWKTDDVTLQNIQARSRAPSVWMLANVKNALLLATSNRSEAAVGYTTMDGDTCGGLSPIAGIDKAFLRQWLRWLEVEGPQGLGPIPALALVNKQQPTAELRPHGSGQTDEKDLMPYDLLDSIENHAIGEKRSPSEVLSAVSDEFPAHDRTQLRAWVTRFFELWCRNQWKRERYAPSFHLDDKNLDPKTWCRFPILSGGYRRELNELRAAEGPKD